MATIKGPSRKFFARYSSTKKVHILVEPYLVTTTFEVGKKKTTPSPAQIKRLNAVATDIIDDFEDSLHDVILGKDREIAALLEAADKKGGDAPKKAAAAGEKIANDTIKSVKQTTDKLEKLLQTKVGAAYKKEKIFKELDTEFKITVAYKVGKATVSVVTNVAETVAVPINPKAWYNIGKAIYDAGTVIHDAAKNEETLRDELFKAISKETTSQLKLWEQVPGNDNLLKKFQRWRTDTSKNLEAKRKRYDVDLGKKLKSVDAASKHVAAARKKLNSELKSLPQGLQLKHGIPAGKGIMEMQKKVSKYEAALKEQHKFADDMAMLVKEMGVSVDRNSFQQRVRSLQVSPKEIFAMAKQVKADAESIKGMIDAIGSAVKALS